jgi:hypothetical protein
MVCFYFVMTVFATVGFGDIYAHTTGGDGILVHIFSTNELGRDQFSH